MSTEDIKKVFEAKAIEKYGSVFKMSKQTGIHYNILMRYRNNPSDVRLITIINILDLLDLKIDIVLK